jgi:hypothetical protein
MTKHELLKIIGFSEEYLDYLRRIEESDIYVLEPPRTEYLSQSYDVANVIVNESANSFSTWIVTKNK